MVKFSSDYDALVGSIYDCAANPELWPQTLERIRQNFDGSYAMVGFADYSSMAVRQAPTFKNVSSPWDMSWFDKILDFIPTIPNIQSLMMSGIDSPWLFSENVSQEEFQKSLFYEKWAKPQQLGDSIQTMVLDRKATRGFLVFAGREGGRNFGESEKALAAQLSPHIRRAILINDIVDKGNMAVTLYRQVLDQLATAVFVVGPGQNLIFANAAGERMLTDNNFLSVQSGVLKDFRIAGHATTLEAAVGRAVLGDVAVGIRGIGVPLVGKDGDRAAAYVLPIAGDDVRGTMGNGCCAVFVAKRGEQQPMLIEVLRTMFDLTVTEARVVMLLAKGDGPQTIAESLQISVNTVRTHLKHAYAKTDTPDQTALVALIHTVLPPVAVA